MELIALLLEKFLRLFRSSFLCQNYVLAEASLVHGYLFLSEGPLLIWICLLSLHLLYFSWVIFYYKKWNFSLVLILLILIGFPCFRKDPYSARPFEGLNIVDVGCGGGILSEVFIYLFSLSFPHFNCIQKKRIHCLWGISSSFVMIYNIHAFLCF